MRSPFKFRRYGESGIEVSELFAKTAQHIDDMAVIRSMHAISNDHGPALYQMNTGTLLAGHPRLMGPGRLLRLRRQPPLLGQTGLQVAPRLTAPAKPKSPTNHCHQ